MFKRYSGGQKEQPAQRDHEAPGNLKANGLRTIWAAVGIAALLAGCANVGQQPQPGQPKLQPQPDPTATANPSAASLTGGGPADDASGAGPVSRSVTKVVTKTTWVRVRRGDTLERIASHQHVSLKELEAWNRIKAGRLRPGQSLKIVTKQTITVQVAAPGRRRAADGTASGASPMSLAERREVAAEVARHARGVALVWPARGPVVQGFEPGTTRGIEIAGKPGDPVRAAADGTVMYAGTGLNEYGSLIIVQHNKDYLTAYSHNRRLLVKTGDIVRQGQEIAEMGSEDASRVAVLFEVRHDGKPVDPMPFLPPQG